MKPSSSSSVICQTTSPKPLPKRFLHIVRSRAPSFNWQYSLLSLRSSSSFLRLLPRLLVTSICPFIFPSITCWRRQFLRRMWPIQLAFRFLISCRIFLCSLTLSDDSNDSNFLFISYYHIYFLLCSNVQLWFQEICEWLFTKNNFRFLILHRPTLQIVRTGFYNWGKNLHNLKFSSHRLLKIDGDIAGGPFKSLC